MNAAPSTNATTSRLTAVLSYGILLLLLYLIFRIAEPFLGALGLRPQLDLRPYPDLFWIFCQISSPARSNIRG